MKKHLVMGALVVTSLVQVTSVAHADKATIGGIIGGVIGGLAGSKIGKGNGNTAATIVGAIAGSLIGNKVGSDMDEADRRALADAQSRAFRGGLGSGCDWDGRGYGSRTGARGRIVTTREGYNYAGEYCREYESVIYTRSNTETTRGVACTRPDGSWYETQTTQVRWGGGRPGMGGGRMNPAPYTPAPAPIPVPSRPLPPPAPGGYDRAAQVTVSNITRRSGGEWVRVTLNNPVIVDRIEVRALSAGVQAHAATVYTLSGRQVNVRELSNTSTFYAGDTAVSENLNLREPITTIDLNVESMGGNADISVRVISNDSSPSLSVNRY